MDDLGAFLCAWQRSLLVCDEKIPVEKLAKLDYVARVLARQRPARPPGTCHGYHATTIGFYLEELIRRVDFTASNRQFWTRTALVLTVVYAVFVTANYVVQFATVIPVGFLLVIAIGFLFSLFGRRART